MEIHQMSTAANAAPASEAKDFKKDFEEAIGSNFHNEAAKSIAKTVLTKLTAGTVASGFSDINKRIAEAAMSGDTEKVLELSGELKKVKDSQKTHEAGYAAIRKANDFSVVLQVYKNDIEKLAYEIAYTVLTSTHTALSQPATKGKRGPNKPKDESGEPKVKTAPASYTITKGGESITLILRRGNGGLKMDEKEFAFLGFKVVEKDGKEVLDPPTLNNGKKTVEAGRKSIKDAIVDKSPQFKDYTIVENKPAE
jgi:hypothetical protein